MNDANALVLTGGGARGAYQAGVIQGVAEIAQKAGQPMPFKIIAGVSAGAINGAYVAAAADRFFEAAPKLSEFWAKLETSQVIRTDVLSFGGIVGRFLLDALFGGLKKTRQMRALVDTSPLRSLLNERIPTNRIQENLAAGVLDAIELTATDYQSAESISFIMSRDPTIAWQRNRRRSVRCQIGIDHVMGSSALPVLFPPVGVGGRHYGDGSLRNQSPLSPAIRLGARRLLIVGCRHPRPLSALPTTDVQPTFGRILGVLLNAVMMDATETDIEHLSQINDTLDLLPLDRLQASPLRKVDYLYIRPSIDLGALATEKFDRLPETLKFLIKVLGNRKDAAELASYLFFEPAYCAPLTEIGREDALKQETAIAHLLFS